MQIIGRSDLNGFGKGGEGLALKQYAGGQRVLYLAHESGPMCISVIDVTHPEQPTIITQIKVEAPYIRCNSLGLAGNTLVVAHQTENIAQAGAGLDVYDIADPTAPTKLAHFDTSGPHSRGVHFVWFTDGRYAYLSTGARDFTPRNKLDDQFLMIVDVSDPRHPREAGRWWLPGTREGDSEPPPPRVAPFDAGIRMHSLVVPPDKPDRAYVGWIDGGWVILDIADKAHPRLIAHRSWQSLGNGFAHTVLPIIGRGLAIQTEEATENTCKDWPKRNWVWDIGDERHPIPLAVAATGCRPGGAVQGGRTVRRAQHPHEPPDRDVAHADPDGRGQLFQRRRARLFDQRSEPARRDRLPDPTGAAAERHAHHPDQ